MLRKQITAVPHGCILHLGAKLLFTYGLAVFLIQNRYPILCTATWWEPPYLPAVALISASSSLCPWNLSLAAFRRIGYQSDRISILACNFAIA
jgi:hypothetical protein